MRLRDSEVHLLSLLRLELQVAGLTCVGLIVKFVGSVVFWGNIRDILRIWLRFSHLLLFILLLVCLFINISRFLLVDLTHTTLIAFLIIAFTLFISLGVVIRAPWVIVSERILRIGSSGLLIFLLISLSLSWHIPQLSSSIADPSSSMLSIRTAIDWVVPSWGLVWSLVIGVAGLYKVSCRGLGINFSIDDFDSMGDFRREGEVGLVVGNTLSQVILILCYLQHNCPTCFAYLFYFLPWHLLIQIWSKTQLIVHFSSSHMFGPTPRMSRVPSTWTLSHYYWNSTYPRIISSSNHARLYDDKIWVASIWSNRRF